MQPSTASAPRQEKDEEDGGKKGKFFFQLNFWKVLWLGYSSLELFPWPHAYWWFISVNKNATWKKNVHGSKCWLSWGQKRDHLPSSSPGSHAQIGCCPLEIGHHDLRGRENVDCFVPDDSTCWNQRTKCGRKCSQCGFTGFGW